MNSGFAVGWGAEGFGADGEGVDGVAGRGLDCWAALMVSMAF